VRENYDSDGFDPIPAPYLGGKWHWMRGIQDSTSNYRILEDPDLPALVEKIRQTGKPVIFEEELDFTRRFVDMFPDLPLIIPHLGLLGGYPLDFLEAFKNDESIRFDTALGGKETIHQFIRTVGPERVLFGSDVPFGSMRTELAKVLALPLNDDDRDLVLAQNFIRLTGFRPENL
jgi:predicted TIM-barrel fold metal-dependent hydrolase